jgi:hypothetical protein
MGFPPNIVEDISVWLFMPGLAIIQESREVAYLLGKDQPESETLCRDESVDTVVQQDADIVYTCITGFPVSAPPRSPVKTSIVHVLSYSPFFVRVTV